MFVKRGLRMLLLGFAVGLIGCAPTLGRMAVKTPNQGQRLEQLDAAHESEPAMDGAVIDYRLRVAVTEPEAWLSAWIIDPSNEVLRRDGENAWFDLPHDDARETSPPHATVIILHGYRHFKNDWAYLMWARYLAQYGYRIVLIDLRGHGGSTGDWSTFGPGEARDLVQVINDLDRRGFLVGRLGVLGGSFGGATAIQLAGLEPRVEAVVTVSAFASMREAVPAFIKAELGILTGLVGIWGWDAIVDAAGAAGGFDPDAADARRVLSRTEADVLVLHSTADRHIPPTQARALAEAGGPRVRLELLDDLGHFDFGVKRASQVLELTRDWFDQHLADDPPARN